MENKLFDRKHVGEYLLFGSIAAVAFMIFVIMFLNANTYENLVLVYAGNIAFVIVIAIHGYKQTNRQYEGKSAVRMLISGHLTILAGVILATIFSVIATYVFFGNLGTVRQEDKVLENGDMFTDVNRPSQVLMMILIYAIVVNFAVGSFATVLMSYVIKRNQTRDKPAELDKEIQLLKK